jgi:FkbM family methyltransferase
VYPDARIISVEADFDVLTSNVAGEPRIFPIHGCIVPRLQSTVLFDNQGPAYSRRLGVSGIRVPAIMLDALLKTRAIRRVDLLKLDIEGAEREVLAKGRYLDSVQNVIAELHGNYSFSDFREAVAIQAFMRAIPTRTAH